MIHIQINTLWRVVAPGPARGVLHRVCCVDDDGIVAVQDCSQPAWSWAGGSAEFLTEFRFVAPAPGHFHR